MNIAKGADVNTEIKWIVQDVYYTDILNWKIQNGIIPFYKNCNVS